LLLLTTTVLVPLFMTFLPMLAKTALPVILLSIPLATLHGFLEETFWRGLYIASFPGRPLLACALPTAFFALWHLAPQVALPADAPWLFVLATLPLGAVYASTAYTTRSALPSAIAHSVSGIFAFSGYLAPAMLSVL
jgi:hypothetical protein